MSERFRREACKCRECSLSGIVKVASKGIPQGIAFFGEAPGREEEIQGEPFVGDAGKYLSWGMEKADISRSQVWVGNILSCKLSGNDWLSFEAMYARDACKPGLEEELKFLADKGVRVIVALGLNVAREFGISGSSMEKIRGSVYEYQGFYVIPTYHPSYFHRMSWKREQDDAILDRKYVWVCDLEKAKRIAKEGWSPPREIFNLHPSVEEIETFIYDGIATGKTFAVDIETTGIGWDSKIVVIGLAVDSEHAMSIQLLGKAGVEKFIGEKGRRVKEALDALFNRATLIFQNALFDVEMLKRNGYNITYDAVEDDTMLLHHTLAPEQPHTLPYIVSIYGATPYWKEEFQTREGSIFQMDEDEMLRYNLRDCVVLHQIVTPMREELVRRNLYKVYNKDVLPLLGPVGEMMETGIKLDVKGLRNLKSKYIKKLTEIEKELRTLLHIPKGFNFSSPDDMTYLLFGIVPRKFEKLEDLPDYDEATTRRRTKSGKPSVLSKNTEKYRMLMELKGIKEETEIFQLPPGFKPRQNYLTKKFQTDEQGLLSLDLAMIHRLNILDKFKHPKEVHLTERKQIEKQRKWLTLFQEYKEYDKLFSTYTSFPRKPDGKVHTSFLIHGTVTGRLSSRSPNFQNLPKEHSEIRDVFVADEGHTFISGDYCNLEVLVLAYVTNDQPLINLLESGENMHDVNTRILFNITPDSPKWKEGRKASKVFMFGGISYGGGDREIYQKVLLQAPGLGLPFSEYVAAKERWMEAHPAYREWAERVKKEALITRTSKIFTGRIRELMGRENDIKKQALNTPIQGGAAAIVNKAMIEFYEEKRSSWKIILQIHDQIVISVPDAEIPVAVKLLKNIMERPVMIYSKDRKFPVEIEIGKRLGSLEVYHI